MNPGIAGLSYQDCVRGSVGHNTPGSIWQGLAGRAAKYAKQPSALLSLKLVQKACFLMVI